MQYIIGITGSKGKTTCSYTLYQYFKSLDYNCCLINSDNVIINDKELNISNTNIKTKKNMDYFMYLAQDSEFVIIEITENGIANNIYDDISFDYKILTNFINGFDKHCTAERYLELKTKFFNAPTARRIINKSIDSFEYFSTENSVQFNTSLDVMTNLTLCNAIDTKTKGIWDTIQSLITEVLTIFTNSTHIDNIKTVLAFLADIDMLDLDYFFGYFLTELYHIKGRMENLIIGGKKFLFDSAEVPSNTNYSRCLLSVPSVNTFDLYTELISDEDYISLNKYRTFDTDTRKNCLIFGGNLYLALNHTSSFPNKPVYEEVIEEAGQESFYDYINNNYAFPDDIQSILITYTDMINNNMPISKNFWFRSIPALKAYMTIHYSEFLQVCSYFESLDFQPLTSACVYLREMADYCRKQYGNTASLMQQESPKKIYLTVDQESEWKNRLDLEMISSFFTVPIEIFTKRQDALQKIAKESDENDNIIISGRGYTRNYHDLDNPGFEFTDEEYLRSILEVEENVEQ